MRLRFEDFVLDLDRQELRQGGQSVVMTPQAFDLLVFLVRQRERVVSKDDLFEGVWKGRLVSDSTLASHINAVRRAVDDDGARQRLIRTIARKGFRFVGEVSQDGLPPSVAASGALSQTIDAPSLAVLPFVNLSPEPGRDYLADGIIEDLIQALTRIRRLRVAARDSTFVYRGRNVDVRRVGQDLGVRYVLSGSVRCASAQIRVAAQLVDTDTGMHIWVDRFDGSHGDLFAVQDALAASVVGALTPHLERAEIGRALRKPTESLDAYDHYLRGMAHFHRGGREGLRAALRAFYKAIEIDPGFGSAYGASAWSHVLLKQSFWMDDFAKESAEGLRLAALAVEVDRDDALALTWGAYALGHFGEDLEICRAHMDRALKVNPNLTPAWYLSGAQRLSAGRHEEGLSRISQAAQPGLPEGDLREIAILSSLGNMLLGRPEEASTWAMKAFEVAPNLARAVGILASSHALSGRRREAERAMAILRRQQSSLRAGGVKDWIHLRRAEDLEIFTEGLRLAGLPK